MHHKGKFIVLVGPDGTGKTTIADSIEESIGSHYTGLTRFHWRPGLLPTPGKFNKSGTSQPDSSQAEAPPTEFKYGTVISLVRYLYFLTDFTLGYWLKIWPRLRRGQFIIGERWYYDIPVHPERYAFRLPGWLLRTGGLLVPKPDASILLYGDPDKIHARKPELPPEEIRRHILELEQQLPHGPRAVRIATDRPINETLAILEGYLSNTPSDARTQKPIWAVFPSRRHPRVYIGGNDSVRNALNLYQAHSLPARLVKLILQKAPERLARLILPAVSESGQTDTLNLIQDGLNKYLDLPDCPTSAYLGTASSHQKITFQVTKDGRPYAYIKCANSDNTRRAVSNEAAALLRLDDHKPVGFLFPKVISSTVIGEYSVLITTAPSGPTINRSSELEHYDSAFINWIMSRNNKHDDIDSILDRMSYVQFYESLANESSHNAKTLSEACTQLKGIFSDKPVNTNFSHGDYAPWNTLRLDNDQLYVFDWEYFQENAPAFNDLLHFIYMPLRLIKKRSPASSALTLLKSSETPEVKSLLSSRNISADTYSGYIILYLIGQLIREYDEYGELADHTVKTLDNVLSRTGGGKHLRRVLVSAYACEPNEGSEPGVGWNWVQQISRSSEAWVITRANNRKPITEELKAKPNNNLHFVYVNVPRWLSFWKKGQRGIRTYYYLWQFFAFLRARQLHGEIDFHIGHHVTFVNDWLWTFLCLMPMPYIWGPIGSHPTSPRCMLANKRAFAYERVRTTIQTLMRFIDPLYWLSGLRASAVIAINAQTANVAPLRWTARNRIFIEPAIGMEPVDRPISHSKQTDHLNLLFVGRFAPIKAPHMAVEAFAEFAHNYQGTSILRMIGKGGELPEINSRIKHYEIEDQVEIIEWVTRDEVIQSMHDADIFLFPSMECGGMVVLEAMACGLPVVCLDYGGPGTMVTEESGFRIPIGDCDANSIRSSLARALEKLTDAGIRGKMAAAAQKRVADCYYWDHKAQTIATLYEQYSRQDA